LLFMPSQGKLGGKGHRALSADMWLVAIWFDHCQLLKLMLPVLGFSTT